MTTIKEQSRRRAQANLAIKTYLDRLPSSRQAETRFRTRGFWQNAIFATWNSLDAAEIIHASLNAGTSAAPVPSVDDLEAAFWRAQRRHFEDREDALERWRNRPGIAWAEADGIKAAERTLTDATPGPLPRNPRQSRRSGPPLAAAAS